MNQSSKQVKQDRIKRVIVKIGSSLVSAQGNQVATNLISGLVADINQSQSNHNCSIILVSSGAVACGLTRLGLTSRPSSMVALQAIAAIGQSGLMRAYDNAFAKYNLNCAQVLLTHADLNDRKRYLSARATIEQLLSFSVVPIINENDTVTIDGLRFDDNDILAAFICNLVNADLMILLSDQQGLFDKPPPDDNFDNPGATLITEADVFDPMLNSVAGDSGPLGRGGMKSKIRAARFAAQSATQTIIAHGRTERIIERILMGEALGTHLKNTNSPAHAKKHWLRARQSAGTVQLDSGAARALLHNKKSLLPVGVVHLSNQWSRGDVISCINQNSKTIARGIANYSSEETTRIRGKPSNEIAAILGYDYGPELINRDNLVLENG